MRKGKTFLDIGLGLEKSRHLNYSIDLVMRIFQHGDSFVESRIMMGPCGEAPGGLALQ